MACTKIWVLNQEIQISIGTQSLDFDWRGWKGKRWSSFEACFTLEIFRYFIKVQIGDLQQELLLVTLLPASRRKNLRAFFCNPAFHTDAVR